MEYLPQVRNDIKYFIDILGKVRWYGSLVKTIDSGIPPCPVQILAPPILPISPFYISASLSVNEDNSAYLTRLL